jgi:predicted glycoside hydrolase/deacetylase ChbG (UPF0249 family)
MFLIVNADDFGLTRGVNRGILDCHLAGSVSNASLMVNTSAVTDALEIARANPSLGVGLHFNMTTGRPLSAPSAVRSLVGPDGCFFTRSLCERRLLLGLSAEKEIEREFHAQVERFQSSGLAMTHIDSHQHMHLFPRVFDILAGYCRANDIPLRVPWRLKGPRPGIRRRVRSRFLEMLLRRNYLKWKGSVKTNLGFGSIFDLVEAAASIKRDCYFELLTKCQGSPFELMVHPAAVDDELRSLTRITEFSVREHEILAGFSLGKEAERFGFHLVSYSKAFQQPGEGL